MKKLFSLLVAAFIFTTLLASCNTKNAQPTTTGNKLSIVTTIFPHYDFARAVAGDSADISMLLKPGAEVHSYDPSPADMIAIENADLFIYTGGHNDAWVENLLSSTPKDSLTVLRMMDYVDTIEEEHDHEHEHNHMHSHEHGELEELDEHIWTSPANAVLMVEAIAEALCFINPDNADEYNNNAEAYQQQINELDEEFHAIVDAASQHTLVMADRFPFRYFVEDYHLDYYAAFPGCTTDSNPGAGTVATLITAVKQLGLPYIYTMELSNQNIARAVAEETGCEILQLQSGQNVTQQQFDAGVTYIDLMQQNADSLRKGLQ